MRRIVVLLMMSLPTIAVSSPAAVQTIPADGLVAAARRALPAWDGGTISLRVIGSPTDAVVRAGKVELHAEAVAGRWPRSRVAVPVRIRVDGGVVRSETIWFAVSAKRDVAVYAAAAAAGTPVTAIKTRSAPVDVASMRDVPMKELAGLAGERLRRGVRTGAPVVADDFEPIPDVDRQAKVAVRARFGVIRMDAKGTAMRAGDVGDVVPVLVDGAEAPVDARVLSKGEVEIAR